MCLLRNPCDDCRRDWNLKVTGLMRYKGGVRISLLCGREAFHDYRRKLKAVQGISVLLSAKPDSVLETVTKLKEDGAKKDGDVSRLTRELLTYKTAQYPVSSDPLLVFEEHLLPAQLRQFATMLYEEKKGNVVLVCSGEMDCISMQQAAVIWICGNSAAG